MCGQELLPSSLGRRRGLASQPKGRQGRFLLLPEGAASRQQTQMPNPRSPEARLWLGHARTVGHVSRSWRLQYDLTNSTWSAHDHKLPRPAVASVTGAHRQSSDCSTPLTDPCFSFPVAWAWRRRHHSFSFTLALSPRQTVSPCPSAADTYACYHSYLCRGWCCMSERKHSLPVHLPSPSTPFTWTILIVCYFPSSRGFLFSLVRCHHHHHHLGPCLNPNFRKSS